MKKGRSLGWLAAAATGVLLSLGAGGVILSEGALRVPPDVRAPAPDSLAVQIAATQQARWRAVETRSLDGTILRAWVFEPRHTNGGGVILLHGVADSRKGVVGHARFLLREGYVALVPDSRAHGSSGGDVFTFGLRERDDVTRWADWLKQDMRVARVYGLGESMGAAIAIQSAEAFRAVVAECSFSTFRKIAQYRVAQKAGFPEWMTVPLVEAGFLAARWRYGLDLEQASPLAAVRGTSTPVLLIHGTADHNIPARHSIALAEANPARTKLWLVPGAGHTAAATVEPGEFERRVLAWFAEHP